MVRPRTRVQGPFNTYWRIDGSAIIAQAIERILEGFERGSDGLDDLAFSERRIIEALVDHYSPIRLRAEQIPAQHRDALDEAKVRQRDLAELLVHALKHGEFVRHSGYGDRAP